MKGKDFLSIKDIIPEEFIQRYYSRRIYSINSNGKRYERS